MLNSFKKYVLMGFCLISISLFANIDVSKNRKNSKKDTLLFSTPAQVDEALGLYFSEDSLFTPEQMQEDFRFFYEKIVETHPNPYHVISKDSLDRKVQDILKSLDKPMNRREFWLKTASINTYFDAHTNIEDIKEMYEYYEKNTKHILPENLVMLDSLENMYFTSVCENSSLSGKYIKSINGIPAKQIVDKISVYYSKENPNYTPLLFADNFCLFFANVFGITDTFLFEYIKNDTETDFYTFPFQESSIDTTRTTETEQETEWKPIRCHIYEEYGIALIELNTFYAGLLGEHYREDLEKIMSDITEKNIKHLFIDISANGGGNTINALEILNFIKTKENGFQEGSSEIRITQNYRAFANYFEFDRYPLRIKLFSKKYKQVYKQIYKSPIDSFITRDFYWTKNNAKIQYDKNVYLIQSTSGTHSASVDIASIVKFYKLAIIIGEETGGLTACYINPMYFLMPNTSILFRCSVQKSITVGGAMDGRGVIPDVEYKIENPYKRFTLEQLKEMLQLIEEYKAQMNK